ncbi:hypothetical protein CSX00_07085 [Pseudobutyrivibrio ruminis]|uniref:Uncharacterized protein n=1 Tax=Pseudobutyrivibrio ruminis TaxID=46206 RepID=A0A2G3EAJ1_9FIRM|nr:hypothetical protein [Pseudobutyrivibrio ruminis]PHU40329.1 hypothetical protein CSX00_07085 [Pseudobutyrivibrio ruminis]
MVKKRIFTLMLISTVLLIGCGDNNSSGKSSSISENQEKNETSITDTSDKTVNGYQEIDYYKYYTISSSEVTAANGFLSNAEVTFTGLAYDEYFSDESGELRFLVKSEDGDYVECFFDLPMLIDGYDSLEDGTGFRAYGETDDNCKVTIKRVEIIEPEFTFQEYVEHEKGLYTNELIYDEVVNNAKELKYEEYYLKGVVSEIWTSSNAILIELVDGSIVYVKYYKKNYEPELNVGDSVKVFGTFQGLYDYNGKNIPQFNENFIDLL